ncbi:MAG: hypothetical protein IPK26_26015 [Planctomycetes bacterium]|nr:hypothetical protein [Planctomycetota bacterium]
MRLADLTIDTTRADSGVWWSYETRQPCIGNVPHQDQFCVQARALGDAFHSAMREAIAPYAMAARRGKIDDDGFRRAVAKVWADHVVVSWANLDGIPFSPAKAVEFMAEPRYRLIREFVEQIAKAEWAYLADAEKEAQGN